MRSGAVRSLTNLKRPQKPPRQHRLEILAHVANDVDVRCISPHFVNDAIHAADNLSILGEAEPRQFAGNRSSAGYTIEPCSNATEFMDSSLQNLLKAVEDDKAKLDAARPLPPHTLASLREKLMLEWTYHSNAIEGNTLTLRETKVVLEGITVGGKSLREHFEAINHRDAILYVEGIVAKHEALSEWQIRNIHGLVLKGIDDGEAGRYRRENVVISGASTTPPDFLHLPLEMAALVTWYEQTGAINAVERAAELHTRFVKIHPFVDGNGRTGRLLLNFELMKFGYPPAVIRKEDRLAYYDVLDEACVTGDFSRMTRLVAESVQRSLDTYLDVLGLREH